MTLIQRSTQRVFLLIGVFLCIAQAVPAAHVPDKTYLSDREALDEVQRDAFRYMWEDADPATGMAYEANFDWDVRPVTTGGTGFGVACIVVGVDRGWITRNQAVDRLLKITGFLRERTERDTLHGAFPHWLDANTGRAIGFSTGDNGADIVETSFLMQGLLIARAYFNGPGVEERLRREITELWEGVDWNWFTNGENSGIFWHWSEQYGFSASHKVLGYNECLVTYLLAIASPTHAISRPAYDYWSSGPNYLPREIFGYRIEATMEGGGPLFLAHYSFIGLDPRRLADAYVSEGYFTRNVKQTLANRAYCLQEAPAANKYDTDFWGLTASQVKDGYGVNDAMNDSATVAPTAALSSMPYTPLYSLQVLRNLRSGLRNKIWGKNGPFDAINLRDDWVSDRYLAIDQLPIVLMIENYRTGLLWNLFMADPDVKNGLLKAGLAPPDPEAGFPEAVPTLRKNENGLYTDEAYDMVRHPDTGRYALPYWAEDRSMVVFTIVDQNGQTLFTAQCTAKAGRNTLFFDQFMQPDGKILTVIMREDSQEYTLPIRLH